MRLLFALAFALVCWRTSAGIGPAMRLYRDTCAGSTLAVAITWTALCIGSAAASIYLMATS